MLNKAKPRPIKKQNLTDFCKAVNFFAMVFEKSKRY